MLTILSILSSELLGKYRHFLQISCILLLAGAGVKAQTPVDTLSRRDTLPPSPLRDSAAVDLRRIRISNEALDDLVEYKARDSMWFDVKNKQLHLYGDASVKYTSLNVKAGYILLDYDKNEISAQQFPDTSEQLAGLPQFQDGDQNFSATRLRYNFRSKKGIIYEARTKQEDLYVLGERAKFVSGPPPRDTSEKQLNTIYNKDALITTCDALHPHFGIRTRKLKVIPDKLIVAGFSNVEIGGIPTPLVLPFGFYPITKTRKGGVIIPRDFEFADREGLGIRDWGWYQPISPHMDATVKFNIYTSGSWGTSLDTRYNRRYKYTGNFLLQYNNRVTENDKAQKVSAKSFGIQWAHNQDGKAHPSRRFGGSVNIQTNQNQQRNRNDYQSVFQNQYSSNLNFSKTFPGKPYQFNGSFRHAQNVSTRQMDITFPSLNFNLQRVYPFKRKEPVGKEQWYEQVSLTYSTRLENSFRTVDTLLFTKKTLDGVRLGWQHQASTDFAFKLFKYITLTPNVNYEENWYPYTIEKQLLNRVDTVFAPIVEGQDTIGYRIDEQRTRYGIDTTVRDWGFKTFRTFNAGVSANTVLFMTKQFKRGWLRGIRHKMTPSASMGFGPDFTKPRYNYFRTFYDDLRPEFRDSSTYGIFDEGLFGKPFASRQDMALSYSLGNVIEFKYYSARRDTVIKKRLFDNLVFSGNYNFSADSLKWSTISTGGLFRLFKGATNITWNVSLDPYITDARGVRVNRFALREQGRLFRMSQFGIAFNTGFSVGQLRTIFAKKENKDDASAAPAGRPVKATDDLLSLFEDFRVDHRISFERRLISTGFGAQRDTFIIGTNNLSLSGAIPLTSKWRIDVGNISYDLQEKRLVYPDIGFSRDLHCWILSLSWQPTRGTYYFSINVKPGTLDFLKIPYRKNVFDAGL